MDEVRDVRGQGERNEWVCAAGDAGGEGRTEGEQEQHEPDRAELGQNLEVEIVSVPHLELDLPVLEPVLLVRAGPGPEDGVRLVILPGRLPQLRAVASREREQPLVEVDGARRARGGRRERVVSLAGERDRPAVANEHPEHGRERDQRKGRAKGKADS